MEILRLDIQFDKKQADIQVRDEDKVFRKILITVDTFPDLFRDAEVLGIDAVKYMRSTLHTDAKIRKQIIAIDAQLEDLQKRKKELEKEIKNSPK
jgi:hypothetical protein